MKLETKFHHCLQGTPTSANACANRISSELNDIFYFQFQYILQIINLLYFT